MGPKCECCWQNKGHNVIDRKLKNFLPSTPTPRTKTSSLTILAGTLILSASCRDRAIRNPACWMKCLLKANRANLDASSPVETQEPPWNLEGWKYCRFSLLNIRNKWQEATLSDFKILFLFFRKFWTQWSFILTNKLIVAIWYKTTKSRDKY